MKLHNVSLSQIIKRYNRQDGGGTVTRRKDAASNSCEVIKYFSIYLTPSAALGPGVYSASCMITRNKTKMFLRNRARPARKADNFTAICDPTVQTRWDPEHLKSYRPLRPVTVIGKFFILLASRRYTSLLFLYIRS
jgi:hypothetical protein